MPDLVPASVRASDFKRAGFDTSAMLISPLPAMERPSQGRLEGNITAGAERKVVHVPADIGGLEAELFENRSSLKLLTSQVAMHLSLDERRGLFAAIDRLLSIEHWEDESAQINQEAFRSFLRFTIFTRPREMPNVGVGPDGMVLVGWHSVCQSVHVEFLPKDQCVALIRTQSACGPERMAWRGHIARLRDLIRNNGAAACIER